MKVFEDAGSFRLADLVSLSRALQVCDLDVVLLGEYEPQAFVGASVAEHAIFCRVETDFDFRGRFVLPPDWCMLGCIHRTTEGSWSHGTPLQSGTAFTVLPERSNEFKLSSGSRVTGVLLPVAKLREKLAQRLPHQAETGYQPGGLFRLPDDSKGLALHDDFEKIRDYIASLSPEQTQRAAPDIDEDALLTKHLSAAFSASARYRLQCSRGRRTHYQIVQRVDNYLRANLHDNIYNVDMCAAGGVSERTMRYAFHDMMNISPNRYLSMLRLSRAFRRLSGADPSRCSVKSVALSCGFWDLSRFADSYHRVFRELPHQTLMRTPFSAYQASA